MQNQAPGLFSFQFLCSLYWNYSVIFEKVKFYPTGVRIDWIRRSRYLGLDPAIFQLAPPADETVVSDDDEDPDDEDFEEGEAMEEGESGDEGDVMLEEDTGADDDSDDY